MSYVWCVEISENVSKVGSCIGAVWQYFPHFHNFIDVHSLVTIIKIVYPCCFLAPIVYTHTNIRVAKEELWTTLKHFCLGIIKIHNTQFSEEVG